MNHAAKASRRGFTLIELMLSMAFISALLLAIMMTVVQLTRIYDKGISIKEVNQVGRSLADELNRTISSAVPFDLNDPGTYNLTTGADSQPVGGRLCTGQVSYVWNIGDPDSGVNGSDVRFVKVRDLTGSYCTSSASGVLSDATAVDILREGNRDLVIHNFTIDKLGDPADDVTGQALYAVRFVVGVKDTDLLESNNASCKPPDTAEGGEDFCAVNRFDLVIRAGKRDLTDGDS